MSKEEFKGITTKQFAILWKEYLKEKKEKEFTRTLEKYGCVAFLGFMFGFIFWLWVFSK